MPLRPFQREFVRRALAPGIDTAALSMPRGNGKSWLAAHVLTRALTPGDPLHVAGAEYLLCAASIEQARLCFRFVRSNLEATGEYRFLDSSTRIGIAHKASNTRLRVLSSNGKTAMGVVGCPLAVADEPGSWEVGGGQLMADALMTAQGKPGSRLRLLMIGTLAPATGGWWHDLIAAGSTGSTHVTVLQGEAATWDRWTTIRRANPLTSISPEFRAKLIEERDAARADSRLKARFLSYRLNLPTADESQVLLTVDDWRRVTARPVPEADGRPVVGLDMGEGRAWSAAVALWRSGRCEAVAVAPGLPSIEVQEKRDRVPRGTYARLIQSGRLVTDGERRVPRAEFVIDKLMGWRPTVIVGDRARHAEVLDAVRGRVPVVARITRWFGAAEDVRALRRSALDGPLAVEESSRGLMAASLAAACVRSDDQGSTRLVKADPSNNTGRDDLAAALTLAAGAVARMPRPRSVRIHVAA